MSDWTTDAADAIERSIALGARTDGRTGAGSHAGRRVRLARRLILIPALVLVAIGAFRGLVLIYQGYVWAAWCTLGGIFVIAGVFCWSKRNP